MNLHEFKASLSANQPPEACSPYLQALWYDARGDWEMAHTIVQDLEDKTAAWIHAYLHRKEGDTWNADYWYRRAGRTRPSADLSSEWDTIAGEIL